MRIVEVGPAKRGDALVCRLVEVWERSVRATHLFLTPEAVEDIKRHVPEALRGVAHLAVSWRGAGGETAAALGAGPVPIAFAGVEGRRLEMLFVDPDERGHGVGRALLAWAVDRHGADELGVNEQNLQARGFYEHLGFQVFRRSDIDEQGNPYPILYMRRSG